METKAIAVTGLVRRKHDEGKPVFAVTADGSIQHVGFTSAGFRVFTVPADAVAIAYPLWSRSDAAVFVHEPQDGMPERGTVATWQHKRGFAEALAQLLGTPVESEAVAELMKRVGRYLR